jgi:hypothetical protein
MPDSIAKFISKKKKTIADGFTYENWAPKKKFPLEI